MSGWVCSWSNLPIVGDWLQTNRVLWRSWLKLVLINGRVVGVFCMVLLWSTSSPPPSSLSSCSFAWLLQYICLCIFCLDAGTVHGFLLLRTLTEETSVGWGSWPRVWNRLPSERRSQSSSTCPPWHWPRAIFDQGLEPSGDFLFIHGRQGMRETATWLPHGTCRVQHWDKSVLVKAYNTNIACKWHAFLNRTLVRFTLERQAGWLLLCHYIEKRSSSFLCWTRWQENGGNFLGKVLCWIRHRWSSCK